MESEVTVPIILDTNRADLISVKVADYENISGSTKVTILVQVECRLVSYHSIVASTRMNCNRLVYSLFKLIAYFLASQPGA